ncbi:MAG: DinB family protein [Balneola sp.]
MDHPFIKQIEENTELFTSGLNRLNASELNWKPNLETWSIAQNLEHLIQINITYGEVFTSLEKGTLRLPFYGKVSAVASLFGKLILDAVEPERTKKTKTFTVWEPGKSQLPYSIVDDFRASQNKLKQHVSKLNSHIEKKTILHTPLSKWITIPADTAFEIIITHQRRHYNQVKEVLNLLDKNLN